MNFGGLHQEPKRDAFALHEIILVGVGGHFIFGAAIDHGDAFSAEATGDGGAVDGGVAGTNDYHVAPHMELRGLKLASFDVFEAIEYVFFPGNFKGASVAEADTDEDGVKVLLEVSYGAVDANFLAHFHAHTETLDHGDFGKGDFDGLAQNNDAIGGKSAAKFALFVERDGMTELRELPCAG